MNGVNGNAIGAAPQINHGHTYSYARSMQAREGRLARPFAMPRIPSERFVTREKVDHEAVEGNGGPLPMNGHMSFSNHRRHHPQSLADVPDLRPKSSKNERPKSMDVSSLLPLQSATYPDKHSPFAGDNRSIEHVPEITAFLG